MKPAPKVLQLFLEEIRANGGTQTRDGNSQETIDEYAEAMRAGAKFPPVVVFVDADGVFWLADGFHRYYAALAVKRKKLAAEVHEGSQREARWYALGANKDHGLRRTNADKEKAIKAALEDAEWRKKSNRVLSDHLGVDDKTVATWRKKLESGAEIPQLTERKGADGKTYPAKKEPTRVVREPGLDESDHEKTFQIGAEPAEAPSEPVVVLSDDDADEMLGKGSVMARAAREVLSEGARAAAPPAASSAPASPSDPLADAVAPLRKLLTGKLVMIAGAYADVAVWFRELQREHEELFGQKLATGDLFAYLAPALSAMQHAGEVAKLVASLVPHAPCPFCKLTTKTCSSCKGTGLVTEDVYKRCPEEFRAPGSGRYVALEVGR